MISLCRRFYWAKIVWVEIQIWSKWFKLGAVLGLRWNYTSCKKAGHPSQLDACLPVRLKVLTQKFRMVPLLQRCRHRIQRIKFWMDRMAALKSDESALKSNMHKGPTGARRQKCTSVEGDAWG